MKFELIAFIFTSFASILAVFSWLREELKKSERNRIKLLYPIVFIVLSLTAIYFYYQLGEINKIENEAEKISKNWPNVDGITFLSKGERLGIILTGQTFLEKHKDKFPDTYKDFQALKKGRLGDYKPKHNTDGEYDEYDDLEDVCGATITIIRTFKVKNEVENRNK